MDTAGPSRPDGVCRKRIEQETHSGFYKCWTCGECDGVCPVNFITGRLRPQKIVHLAYLGWLDELLKLPENWYCLSCRQCRHACPNRVKPDDIIDYVRFESVRRGIISTDAVRRYKNLFAMFQRVRWHAVSACFNGSLDALSSNQWKEWISTPIPLTTGKISGNGIPLHTPFGKDSPQTNPSLCLTCSECSGVCPIFCERGLFDPQAIVRMVNLKMTEELLSSPSIWLCLGCERCADSCSQTVKAHWIIRQLQNQAITEGFVDALFVSRLRQAEKVIYPRFFNEIDAIFNLSESKKNPFPLDRVFPESARNFAEPSLLVSIHTH